MSMIWDEITVRLQKAIEPKYQIEKLLGHGGMAGVYLASEPALARRVAIKVMSPMLMSDPQLVQRFEQEARTIAQLHHGNIVDIYEVGSHGDLHYFVMNFVPGRTLGGALVEAGGALPFDAARSWLSQIGGALDYAHRRGIVHRDIKPSNVLLDTDGQAHVTDFGIAKVADHSGLTQTGAWLGTPTYMSPEQCNGEAITGASDQYSLGCVMYEMLAGRPPFEGTPVSMIQAHVARQPEPVSTHRPDCPADLSEAVERMIAKDPEDRWPSLGAMIVTLESQDPTDQVLHSTLVELAGTVSGIGFDAEIDTLVPGESRSVDTVIQSTDGSSLSGHRRVQWASSDDSVVVVSPAGKLSAVAVGVAEVTASFGGQAATMFITVTEDPAGEGLSYVADPKPEPEEAEVSAAVASVATGQDAATAPKDAPAAARPAGPGDGPGGGGPDSDDEPRVGSGFPVRSVVPIATGVGAIALVVLIAQGIGSGGSADDAAQSADSTSFISDMVTARQGSAPTDTEGGATEPETPVTAAVDPAVRAELEGFVRSFAAAMEDRDAANLAVDFLGGVSGDWLNSWAPIVSDTRAYRELAVASADLTGLEATPVRALGTLELVLTYEDQGGELRQITHSARAEFRWADDVWRFAALEEISTEGS